MDNAKLREKSRRATEQLAFIDGVVEKLVKIESSGDEFYNKAVSDGIIHTINIINEELKK